MSTPVKQYMALAESRIGAAFVAEGLYVHLAGGWQSPHTLTFALKLYQPTAANVAKAARLGPAIEAVLGDGPVRIYSDRGAVFVEVPSPWPVPVEACDLQGRGLAVPLGLTSRRAIEGLDFGDPATPHLLCIGPSGRGKSTAMRSVAYHLARQNSPCEVMLLFIAAKPADWQPFVASSHTAGLAVDPAEAQAALTWLAGEMHRRARERIGLPHIFAFVDDLLNLLAVADVTQPLVELASLGRAQGIHLVIGTQRLGKRGAGDAAITGNITTRLVFGTADAQDAAFFSGRADTGAESLGRYPGDCLLIRDGAAVRLATARVADQDLDRLPRDGRTLAPWARQAAAPAHQRTSAPAEKGVNAPVTPENTPLESGAPPGVPVIALESPAPSGAPVLPRRPPTSEDRARIRELFAVLGSKNKTVIAAYGVKNTLTFSWVSDALQEVAS